MPGLSGGGTTNTDVATFLTSSTTSVTNAAIFNIGGINFGVSGSTPSAFTIGTTGGSAFDLTSGGTIQIVSGASAALRETINAPLVLEPVSSSTAGTYTFTNNSASDILNFGGGITGGTTSAGITLSLNGTNAGNEGTISGVIGDGGAAGGLSLVVGGSGTWNLSTATNTYTGTTVINSGTLQLNTFNGAAGELFGTPTITVNSGGKLALNAGDVLGITSGKEALVINSGGTVTNIYRASRVTIENVVTMTGGTLTGTG